MSWKIPLAYANDIHCFGLCKAVMEDIYNIIDVVDGNYWAISNMNDKGREGDQQVSDETMPLNPSV